MGFDDSLLNWTCDFGPHCDGKSFTHSLNSREKTELDFEHVFCKVISANDFLM